MELASSSERWAVEWDERWLSTRRRPNPERGGGLAEAATGQAVLIRLYETRSLPAAALRPEVGWSRALPGGGRASLPTICSLRACHRHAIALVAFGDFRKNLLCLNLGFVYLFALV